MAEFKLGRLGFLYYNIGSFGSPTWSILKRVRDVTRQGGVETIDVATRETDAIATAVVARDRKITTQIVRDTSQASYLAVEAAYDASSNMDILSLDGPVGTVGSRGVRMICQVNKFDEAEPLKEKMTVDIEFSPTLSDLLPSPVRFVA